MDETGNKIIALENAINVLIQRGNILAEYVHDSNNADSSISCRAATTFLAKDHKLLNNMEVKSK